MGNSLLDFVMALVRDPEAAARYAADPAGALSAAGLPGVTITDVQNLIPVVTDSLAATTPSFGAAASDAANVWTSGAAAAALDAFDIPHPMPVTLEPLPQFDAGIVNAPPVDPAPALDPVAAGPLEPPPLDPVGGDWPGDGGWHQPQDLLADLPPAEPPGFDLF